MLSNVEKAQIIDHFDPLNGLYQGFLTWNSSEPWKTVVGHRKGSEIALTMLEW